MKLVLATNNKHKVIEIKTILRKAGLKIDILTLGQFPPMKPMVENKPTLEGNAAKKAVEVARHTGQWALSDDTGLFVRALKGKPGVYAARFAGANCTYADNCRKLIRLMKPVPWSKRQAEFRSVAALSSPRGGVRFAKGRIAGRIMFEPRGKNGFGYDPVFYVPRFKKTFAEMPISLKNKISHRAQAFARVAALVKRVMA